MLTARKLHFLGRFIVYTKSFYGDPFNALVLQGAIIGRVSIHIGNAVNHLHTLDHEAKSSVLTIEKKRWLHGNKKL